MCFRCYNRYPGCNCEIFAYIEPCENGSVNDPCYYTQYRIINVDFGRCFHHSMSDYTPVNNQGPTPGSITTPHTTEDETPVPMANFAPAQPLSGMDSSDSDSDWSDIAQDVMLAEDENQDDDEEINSDSDNSGDYFSTRQDEQDIMLAEGENHDDDEEINSNSDNSDDWYSALESPTNAGYYNAYGVTDPSESDDDSIAGATNTGPGIMDPFEAPAPTEYMSRNVALNESDATGTETIQDTDIDDPDAPDSNDARRGVAGLRARREALRRDAFERRCRDVEDLEARHQAMLEWQKQQAILEHQQQRAMLEHQQQQYQAMLQRQQQQAALERQQQRAMFQRQQEQGVFTITPQSLQDNAAPNVVNARARAAMLRYLADLADKLSRAAQQDRDQ